MSFFLAAALIATAAILYLIRPLTAARTPAQSRSALDAALYKAQLGELERDLERGTISAEEAGAARIEVARRLLAAARAAEAEGAAQPAPPRLSRAAAALAVLLVPAAGAGIYLGAGGAPGMEDQPYAERSGERALAAASMRPSQLAREKQVALIRDPAPLSRMLLQGRFLMRLAEAALEENPDDIRALRMLGEAAGMAEDYPTSRIALQRIVDLRGEEATIQDLGLLFEAMFFAAEYYVSPEAEQVLARIRAMDPDDPAGLLYFGVLAMQEGRPDLAIEAWERFLDLAPPDPGTIAFVSNLIQDARAQMQQGMVPGPALDAMNDAARMSAAEREAQIAAMVAGLDARLAAEGGTVAEWLRLMQARQVLGQTDRAEKAFADALAAFADDPEALAELREAAEILGIRGPGG